ncbi:hypothetical protein BH23CYA1_BH23CYA1_22830 [soil metagenome]
MLLFAQKISQITRQWHSRKVVGLLLACLAMFALTGCGLLNQVPPDQVVKLAIAQQLTQTQQTITQALGQPSAAELEPNFKIKQLAVSEREKLSGPTLQKALGDSLSNRLSGDVYRVRGTFSAAIAARPRQTQDSPFEVYLSPDFQAGDAEVETWYLLKPS